MKISELELVTADLNAAMIERLCTSHDLNVHRTMMNLRKVRHAVVEEEKDGETILTTYLASESSKRPHKVNRGKDGIFY